MISHSVFVQPVNAPPPHQLDQRAAARRPCDLESTARPLLNPDAVSWGGTIQDISAGGLGLSVCYPFSPGTLLAIELRTPSGRGRTLLAKVVHAQDQANGTWLLGCAFAKPLSQAEAESLR